MGLMDLLKKSDDHDQRLYDLSSIPEDEHSRVQRKLRGSQAPPAFEKNPVRILFVDNYCQFCKMWKKVVGRVNNKLAYHATPIKIVNVSTQGYATEMKYKTTELTPELFFDGIVVQGMTSPQYAMGYLEALFGDEIIVEA